MEALLIITVIVHGHVAIETIPFDTFALCSNARSSYNETLSLKYGTSSGNDSYKRTVFADCVTT